MNLIIKPLSEDILEDYLYFFDNAVFTDHPEWSACYCYSFHFTGPAEEWTREKNRLSVTDMIKEGRMKGYLAYADEKPVGWCNANDRSNYQRIMKYYEQVGMPKDKVVSIVCFLVNPEYRRQGITRALLDRITADYSSLDYDYLEAYPGKGMASCEDHYKGPLSLYEQAGFRIEKELDNYFVYRKQLKQ